MDLSGLSPSERRQLAAALRNGERVRWSVPDPAPRGVRLDEIAVLCQELHAADPQLEARLSSLLPPAARPGPLPEVTAVIPCNRQDVLGLRALLGQDCELRVLVLSNGDGPQGLPGAQVVQVDWEGHGATRQAAVDRVQTPYLLFTVDDALPLGAGSVRQLVDALEAGPWDAVIGRQVPWPDADPVTAERVRRWTPPGDRVVEAPQCDHVYTLYRTETLRRWPLPAVPIGEDLAWSRGRRVGYVPMAPVLHSHPRQPLALYQRTRDLHQQMTALGEAPRVPDVGALVRALPGVIEPALQAGPAELLNQLAELLGQWRGGRR